MASRGETMMSAKINGGGQYCSDGWRDERSEPSLGPRPAAIVIGGGRHGDTGPPSFRSDSLHSTPHFAHPRSDARRHSTTALVPHSPLGCKLAGMRDEHSNLARSTKRQMVRSGWPWRRHSSVRTDKPLFPFCLSGPGRRASSRQRILLACKLDDGE